jgi:hypothetical protein
MHARHMFLAISVSAATILGGVLVGCTTDDASSGDGTGGSSGGGTGGANAGTGGVNAGGDTATGGVSGSTGGSGGGPTGTVCAAQAAVTAPTIATFDDCTVGTGDVAVACAAPAIGGTSVFGGMFAYNDATGDPVFSVLAGHTANAVSLATAGQATVYGGGIGIWTSGCLDASSYNGVTFWARGIAPNAGNASMTLMLEETTPSVPAAGSTNRGTCTGTGDQCKPPAFTFPVTDTWTQIHATWAQFTGGNSNGTPVTVTGVRIWQFQWDIGLAFVPETDGGAVYVPVPAAYELQIDDVAFE